MANDFRNRKTIGIDATSGHTNRLYSHNFPLSSHRAASMASTNVRRTQRPNSEATYRDDDISSLLGDSKLKASARTYEEKILETRSVSGSLNEIDGFDIDDSTASAP